MNIILILVSVLLNCTAQLCIRKGMLLVGETGMSNMITNIGAMITNLWLWGAMICYALSIFLWWHGSFKSMKLVLLIHS